MKFLIYLLSLLYFKAQVETLLNSKIKILRTDGGTEYKPIVSKFPQITHPTTCPYTPQQNGLAERKHRHIIELSLAIMSQAFIPHKYWDEIFSSVVYLINRLPSSTSSIPCTTLFNKTPDYSFLRVLGCLCFPYTRPYNDHKLQPRALPCVFLGYALSQKGYKCLHIPTNRIFFSRNVIFDEQTFPFRPTNSSSNLASYADMFLPLIQTDPPNQSAVASASQADPTPQPFADPAHQPNTDPAFTSLAPQPNSSACAAQTLNCAASTSNSPTRLPTPPISSPTSAAPLTPTPQPESQPSPPQTTHPMVTRTRDNTRRLRTFPDHVAYLASLDSEPTTFAQANTQPEWRQAMATEIDALARNQTWTLVPPPPPQNIIGCKWVFKVKRRADGSIERFKARLVAKGFHQEESVDYHETFSPVVRPTTIRVVLSLAVSLAWPIRQLDVHNAFLMVI